MHEGRGQRVLVADSDRAAVELLQIRLEVAGYYACTARNGIQTLDVVKHVRPAAMIIDAALVELDGFEVIRQIRGRFPDLTAPILLTGTGLTVEDVKRGLSLGAQNCLLKPFSGSDAVERIGRLLRGVKKAPALSRQAIVG